MIFERRTFRVPLTRKFLKGTKLPSHISSLFKLLIDAYNVISWDITMFDKRTSLKRFIVQSSNEAHHIGMLKQLFTLALIKRRMEKSIKALPPECLEEVLDKNSRNECQMAVSKQKILHPVE